ncbi:MAG: LLM class flavin-dependent oxidoreductase [Deltaproteobacteria bacterium]|nr:LLM class flavin-dependent oxidoreductase [Deltaproteobacteria bacterium]
MKFGIWLASFSYPRMDYKNSDLLRASAQKAEALGFDSLWVIDHLLHAPGLYGVSWLEPMSVLAHVAACTTRVKLGTGILVVPIRHPVLLAKEIATLDYLSKGRYIFGIGPGWYEREFEVMGTTIRDRGARTDEIVEAVRRLLTEEHVSFHGRFFQFNDVTIEPLPPKMPEIWVAGGSRIPTELSPDRDYLAPSVLRRIAKSDAFLVRNSGSHERVLQDLKKAREYVAQQGRDPKTLKLGCVQFLYIVETNNKEEALRRQRPHFEQTMGTHRTFEHLQESYFLGLIDGMCERIEELRKAGAEYMVLGPVSEELEQLDLIAKYILPKFKD